MGRRTGRSDVHMLLQEMRAIELLASETDVAPRYLQEYWAISADLVSLVTDIEQFAEEHPEALQDDPPMLELRRRLRLVAARLAEVAEED